MIKSSHARRLPFVALLSLLVIPNGANAKGGHSHGRISKAALPLTANSAAVNASAALAAPAAAATPAPKAPSLPVAVPAAAPAPTPGAVIGAPTTQLQPIAPLSPPVTTTTLTAGGTARTDTLTSSSGSSSSPSETAASTAGGGGKSLQDCMAFWDRDAHMTKAEWKGACSRSVHRLENTHVENLLPPPASR
jgi:hypothetical protein